jgi:hypothetical protein
MNLENSILMISTPVLMIAAVSAGGAPYKRRAVMKSC